MEAATLHCPMCGAPSSNDATRCEHCQARLATVACPSCFGMMFLGANFCQHCGTKVERTKSPDALPGKCPRCQVELASVLLGGVRVRECGKCDGLWLDVETFNEICSDREKQAIVLGDIPQGQLPNPQDFSLNKVRYVPCPVCRKLMNRVNFARGSGVVLDICKTDGVWFDRDELKHIVEFIREGGMEAAREKDREAWEAEKRKNVLSVPKAAAGGFEGMGIPTANNGSSALADALALIARIAWNFLK